MQTEPAFPPPRRGKGVAPPRRDGPTIGRDPEEALRIDASTAIGLIAGAFVLGYLLGRVQPREPAPPPAMPDPEALEAVRPVLVQHGKIAAIKAYRDRTGVGLRDAKIAVESLEDR